MIEDMRVRKLNPKTQNGYIRAVKRLAEYLKRSPEDATADELREFQIVMGQQDASPTTINSTLSGLHFLFCKTLDRPDAMRKMSSVPVPRKLPYVLSVQDMKRLLIAANNVKYRTALSVAYGAGLRVSEVVSLKVSDIDSKRKVADVPNDFVDASGKLNKHAQAYFGLFKHLFGPELLADKSLDNDQLVVLAFSIDEVVHNAVAEYSINPAEIENAISMKLLPMLFGALGLDNAQKLIEAVLKITRLGLARG
jgi:integrase